MNLPTLITIPKADICKAEIAQIAQHLTNSLRYKTHVHDITLIECTYLSWAFNINGFDFFLNPYAFFQSKP